MSGKGNGIVLIGLGPEEGALLSMSLGKDALADFASAAAIATGRAHRCGLDLAVHATDVMTGMLTSGETGAFVDMSTTCQRPAPLSPDQARALLKEG